jgi:hypothetical protein
MAHRSVVRRVQHARMNALSRIEGYAIVSDDGMIATTKGTMPRVLESKRTSLANGQWGLSHRESREVSTFVVTVRPLLA